MTQSKNASLKTNMASEMETVQLAVAGSFNHEGNLELETLITNLTNEVADPKTIETAKEDNKDVFPVTVTATYGKYEIDGNGKIDKLSGIELSKTEIIFTEGETNADVQLTATLTADLIGSIITWSSSNTNVATVDSNGKVSVATNMQEDDKNTAIITAEVNGTTYADTCTVTFVETEIYKIEVSLGSETIRVGNTTIASANGKGILGTDFGVITSDVTYSSNDTSVATVSGSTITGEGVGTTTITATYGTLDTAGCGITVEDPPLLLGEQASIAGTYINLGVDLDDDSTTSDWKIVYNDTDNDVIYAITDKTLKIEKVPTGIGLETGSTYSVRKTYKSVNNDHDQTKTEFMNGLKNVTAWKSLISNDILTEYPSIEVYGALEQGDSTTPKTVEYLKGKTGSYCLPSDSWNKRIWLASPHWNVSDGCVNTLEWTNQVWQVLGASYYNTNYGVCPYAILPSDLQVTSSKVGTKIVWNVVTN